MLIVFLLFALFRLPKGAPLTDNHVDTSELIGDGQSLLPRADITFGTRQTSDIVISCLVTIFACTWTAVHPNIPSPMDSRWDKFKRRFIMTTYALLVPEFITVWALRQYIAARDIVRIYNSEIATQTHRHVDSCHYPPLEDLWRRVKEWLFHTPPLTSNGEVVPWTMTHGFFVQMGGFMLCENGKPMQTMSFGRDVHDNSTGFDSDSEMKTGLKYLILSRTIDAPRITADEIQNDRSKGDAISKGLAIFQTTWFIIQCFARWSTHISVTELEIITLAFAMLNGVAYVLWWNKPQNVGFPVYLEKRAPSFVSPGNIGEHQSPLAGEESQNISGKPESTLLKENAIKPLIFPVTTKTPAHAHLENGRVSNDLGTMLGAEVVEGHGLFIPKEINQKDIKTVSKSYDQAGTAFRLERAQGEDKTSLEKFIPSVLPPLVKFMRSARRIPTTYLTTIWALSKEIGTFFSTSKHIVFKAFSRLRKIVAIDHASVRLGDFRVPMFHAERRIGWLLLDGGLEHRITYLSTVCLLFGCAHFIPSFFLHFPSRTEMWLWRISAGVITTQPAVTLLIFPNMRKVGNIPLKIHALVVMHGAPLYMIARITLIILSLLSLRHLPDDAFFTIDWVSSILHL